jgi:hypothetical protein
MSAKTPREIFRRGSDQRSRVVFLAVSRRRVVEAERVVCVGIAVNIRVMMESPQRDTGRRAVGKHESVVQFNAVAREDLSMQTKKRSENCTRPSSLDEPRESHLSSADSRAEGRDAHALLDSAVELRHLVQGLHGPHATLFFQDALDFGAELRDEVVDGGRTIEVEHEMRQGCSSRDDRCNVEEHKAPRDQIRREFGGILLCLRVFEVPFEDVVLQKASDYQ